MATTVTAPLERQFGQLQGLSQMTSTSSGGSSVIVLPVCARAHIDIAEEEVQSAITRAELSAVQPSRAAGLQQDNPADAPVLTLAITSNSIPLSQVKTWSIPALRPSSRSWPVSDWSASAAARSRPCAFRPTDPALVLRA